MQIVDRCVVKPVVKDVVDDVVHDVADGVVSGVVGGAANRTVFRAGLCVMSMSIASALLAVSASAQDPEPRIRILEAPRAMMAYGLASSNRAVIGVALAPSALGDTLGLSITDVSADGPAAGAGIKAGSRIQAVNGVSLRISATDARDPLTADAGYRRLQRELAKLEPGDTVTLSVLDDGQVRNVAMATTSASSLTSGGVQSLVARSREAMESRAGLGMRVSSAGNARDTLGVFITSVVTDGPVEKAGVIEGERVAAINGVDVRVPREDARDASAASARVSRFSRELAKVKPGEQVTLRVYGNGRYRDVTVTAGKATDFGGAVLRLETVPGVEMFWRAPVTPRAPGAPNAPSAPRTPSVRSAPSVAPFPAPPRLAPTPPMPPASPVRALVRGIRRTAV